MHVHHGLSAHADQWAAFCEAICGQLGIPLKIARVVVPRDSGEGLEAAARRLRYEALAGCDVDVLLLAHHRGDQAETLLFNLLRGSGVTGAAAIPEWRMGGRHSIFRPLLGVSRSEIEACARDHGWPWIDDESNVDQRHARNYLRHSVMPQLSARFPAAEAMLAQASAHFSEADSLLSDLGEQDWQRVADDLESAAILALRQLSLPRLKNLLRWRLRQLGWRSPAAARLHEFAVQLQTAAPDRHPLLDLPDGRMQVAGRRLHWVAPA